MALFVSKKGARSLGNEIDRELKNIDQITQSEIDRVCDKIDAELNSCERELSNSIKTLQQIEPLLSRVMDQVAQNAPDHVQVLLGSITQEISSKVATSIDNQLEVQKNIKDVDTYTNQIDESTNIIDKLTDKIQD